MAEPLCIKFHFICSVNSYDASRIVYFNSMIQPTLISKNYTFFATLVSSIPRIIARGMVIYNILINIQVICFNERAAHCLKKLLFW